MRGPLAAIVGLCLLGCRPAPLPDATGSTGGDGQDPTGGDVQEPTDPTGGDVPVFGECLESGDCAAGLACVPWSATPRSYCLEPCPGDTCDAGSRCAGGYCLLVAAPYAEWTIFHDCGEDAVAVSLLPTAPLRCVPYCELTAPVCPELPSDIAGTPPSCTILPGLNLGLDLGLCTTLVAVGELCDEAALRCAGAERPDSDADREALAENGYDPGALACLPAGAQSRCLRVCSIDGGASESPCECPAGDPMCADPADLGLAWECHGWTDLLADHRACVPVESCADTECADNTLSELTRCAPTPYTEGSSSLCAAP